MDRRDFLKSASVVPFLGTIATAALLDAPSHPNPRITLSLDGSGWKLCGLAPGEGERLGLFSAVPGAAEFRAVSVPNDVQMLFPDPCGQGKDIIEINRKEWWYVRPFRGLELKSHQQARLVFEGVDYFADVWLNGEKLGSHEGAFTSFAFDITRRIRQKDDNRLAVRVTAPWKLPGRSHFEFMKGGFEESWDALPGPGQIVFPLGLHRSVRVEVTAATRIEELGIATTRVEERKAVLQVRALVSNNAANVGGPRLQLSITPENFSGPTLQVADRAISFRGKGTIRKSRLLRKSVILSSGGLGTSGRRTSTDCTLPLSTPKIK